MMGKVVVWVDVDGSATVEEWPPGVSDERKKAFECVIRKLSFAPATRDGKAFRSSLEVSINFGLTDGQGEQVTLAPPAQASSAEEMAHARADCSAVAEGRNGEAVVESRVAKSGKVTSTKVVASSGDAQVDRAARCIMERTRFTPGTRNGDTQAMMITSKIRIETPGTASRGEEPPPATGTPPP